MKYAITLLLLTPLLSSAQDMDMGDMMEQMQKMQACMQKIDQSKLDAMEQKGRMDCQRSMQQDCREPESYDSYQRKRETVIKDK